MTRTIPFAAAGATVLAGALALATAAEDPSPEGPGPGLVTLYAGDPVSHTLNLRTGAFGARIEGTTLREARAHLDYGNYEDDALVVALDEDDRGLILDLGHWADIARAYEIHEADGGGIGFASIHHDGSQIKIARTLPRDSFQNLVEARPLLSSLGGEHRAALHPVPGHIYLARIEHRRGTAPGLYAKMLVVAHEPGVSVTLRWEPIPGL